MSFIVVLFCSILFYFCNILVYSKLAHTFSTTLELFLEINATNLLQFIFSRAMHMTSVTQV